MSDVSQTLATLDEATDRWLEEAEQTIEQAKAHNDAEQQAQDEAIRAAVEELEVSGDELLALLEEEKRGE